MNLFTEFCNTHDRQFKVMIVGDCMIDQFYHGKIERISPEFPVPVLKSDDWTPSLPGGAANVAHQLTNFTDHRYLVGIVNNRAESVYSERGIDCEYSYLLMDGYCQVPIKTRLYADDHPVLRWDIEPENYGLSLTALDDARDAVVQRVRRLLEDRRINVAVLSDYDKGLWDKPTARAVVNLCRRANVPTIVDPKKGPLSKWKGCTIFKPNEVEARRFTRLLDADDNCGSLACTLRDELECQYVVITRTDKGIAGYDGTDLFEYKSEGRKSAPVQSVVGAGDCFAAMLAMGVAQGMDFKSSCALAFEASTEYVSRKHNEPLSLQRLKSRLNYEASKLIAPLDLFEAQQQDYADEKFIFANGCYDLLHPGHINTLRFAKSKGDKLIVGLNSDESVRRLKGDSRPIQPYLQRAKVLAALDCVDFVVGFDQDTPELLVKTLRPYGLVKGDDYADKVIAGESHVEKVWLAPHVECSSTSEIVERIEQNWCSGFDLKE